MYPPIEIGYLAAAEWLKINSQWTIAVAAMSGHALIAQDVTKCFRGIVGESDCASEEVPLADVVGIVRRGNVGGRTDVQLRRWHTRFKAFQLSRGQRNRFDDTGRRQSADRFRAVV